MGPFSRKDLTLDMRSSEDAEGERRMMGCSSRREGFLSDETSVGLCGIDEGAGFVEVLEREDRNVPAILRYWEKSCWGI